MDAEQLRQYLEFYQDMGIRTLYRREASAADVGQAGPEGAPPANPPAPEAEGMAQILSDIGDCRRCRLHEGRNKLVFGVGNERAPLVFVGEGVGFESDENEVILALRTGETIALERAPKREIADRIFDEALKLRLALRASDGR